jgi:hypothetical protein
VLRRFLAGVVLAGVAAAVGAGATPGGEREAGACQAPVIRGLVGEFVQAFNRGDSARLDRLFAQPPAFKWYSSGAPGRRLRAAAHRRDTLVRYFRARHDRGDTLRVESLRFIRGSGGLGHFGGTFRRSARDFRAGRPFVIPGKGAALCAADGARFVVVSLGGARGTR